MPSQSEWAAKLAADFAEGAFPRLLEAVSAEMAAALPVSALGELRNDLVEAFGPFKSVGPTHCEERGDLALARTALMLERGAVDLKMSFRGDRVVGLFVAPHEEPAPPWRCPDYADPRCFEEIEVEFADLPGSLVCPLGGGRAPAVVLVHGSGPHDRDESLGPNRPFRDLAWGLASRGVAVLRYEKRTRARPADFAALSAPTVREEVLDDVALALRFLRGRPEIERTRIYALGHSLGGMLGPRIAAENSDLAGLVLMAAPARDLADITVAQFEYLASLSAPDPDGERRLNEIRSEARRIKAARSGDVGPPFLGVPLSYWADLNAYDPVAVARTLTLPILTLQGGRDYQVTEADFRLFERGLRDNPRASHRLFPKLNHLMMAGEGRSTPQDYKIAGHVDVEVVETIASFIRAS